MKPYIGVTGFSNKNEVERAVNAVPRRAAHQLMVGTLVSWKSLRGIPLKPKWQKQFPKVNKLDKLFSTEEKTVNLVHYCPEEDKKDCVLGDMLRIHNLAEDGLDGFQLNMAWPSRSLLEGYRNKMGKEYRIVLQISRSARERVTESPEGLAEKISSYQDLIDDVLLDPSSGHGRAFNPSQAKNYLSALQKKNWNLGLGIAGGLGPDSLEKVESLADDFPRISIDAQGKLRDSEGGMNLKAVENYLVEAYQLFSEK